MMRDSKRVKTFSAVQWPDWALHLLLFFEEILITPRGVRGRSIRARTIRCPQVFVTNLARVLPSRAQLGQHEDGLLCTLYSPFQLWPADAPTGAEAEPLGPFGYPVGLVRHHMLTVKSVAPTAPSFGVLLSEDPTSGTDRN